MLREFTGPGYGVKIDAFIAVVRGAFRFVS